MLRFPLMLLIRGNTIMINNCEGCRSYNETMRNDAVSCFSEFSHDCPCPRCIIKMMCNKPCDSFQRFRAVYSELGHRHRDYIGTTND